MHLGQLYNGRQRPGNGRISSGRYAVNSFRAYLMLCAAVPGAAQAASLHIAGSAGHLSEWEMQGDLVATGPEVAGKFTGPITWKHVGLCSVNGPQEKPGEMTVQIVGSEPSSRISATLSMDGAQCTYSGKLGEKSSGLMDCSNAKGVPVTLSFK